MRTLLLTALCIVAPLAGASAQPMRDLSMPLNESLKQQPASRQKAVILNNGGNVQPREQPQVRDNYIPAPPEPRGDHFMDNFCDPSFKVGGIAQTSITDCLVEKRQQACQQYDSLPTDVRKVMNLAIDCQYTSTENSGSDDGESEMSVQVALPRGCERTPELRLDLLKKYYSDNYVSHALLFLPEEALNGGAQCVMGSR